MAQVTTKPAAPRIDQVKTLKDTLNNTIRDLIGLVDVIKLTEKERRYGVWRGI